MTMSTIIDYKTLSFREKATLTYSFAWRGVAVTAGSVFCAMLVGGIAGFIIGMLVSVTGAMPSQRIADVARIAGFCTGIGISVTFLFLYVRWLLTRRLGGYRLLLVRADSAQREA